MEEKKISEEAERYLVRKRLKTNKTSGGAIVVAALLVGFGALLLGFGVSFGNDVPTVLDAREDGILNETAIDVIERYEVENLAQLIVGLGAGLALDGLLAAISLIEKKDYEVLEAGLDALNEKEKK